MNTTCYSNRNRRRRWLSPERVRRKFEELRTMLRGHTPDEARVQAEFAFSIEQPMRQRA